MVRVDYAARLSPDGRFLFTNSVRDPKDKPEDGGTQNANDVWDARTGKHLHRLEKPEAWYPPAGFSPDSRLLYLGGHSPDWPERGRIRADALTVWDPATGKLLRRFIEPDRPNQARHLQEFGRQVQALAVSPDGRLLAAAEGVGSSDGIWLYETASGRPLKKLAGHSGEVHDLAFSPDGRRLVSVSRDQTGLVWDVTLPALVARPEREADGKRTGRRVGAARRVGPRPRLPRHRRAGRRSRRRRPFVEGEVASGAGSDERRPRPRDRATGRERMQRIVRRRRRSWRRSGRTRWPAQRRG